MAFFGLGSSGIELTIHINEVPKRKKVNIKDKNGNVVKVPLFTREEDVTGKLMVKLTKGKKVEHQGIKIELIGRIDMHFEKSQSSDFSSNSRELEAPGTLNEDKTYEFAFNKIEKSYESYTGQGVRLRYFLKATFGKGKLIKEEEFAVYNVEEAPTNQPILKNEVGIEECLHLEFEYTNGKKYHIRDCVMGKVYFHLVRIKLKYMELQVVKKETLGSGQNAQTDSETLGKYELMDGCAARGEIIPIRLFLRAFELTPTYDNINNKFSVKYYLNLVLVDQEDRRYFKHQEIVLWRNKLV